MSRELSANAFNEYWNKDIKISSIEPAVKHLKHSVLDDSDVPVVEIHILFDFLNNRQNCEDSLLSGLGGLLPESQGEDYEELDFTNKMKKKRKRQNR